MCMDKQEYVRLNITLPTELLKKFEEYCEKEGMMLSSRIAVLIKKDLGEKEHHKAVIFGVDLKKR